MVFSRNKKNNVYPCKSQFYFIKVGFKGSKLYRFIFMMGGISYELKNKFESATVNEPLGFKAIVVGRPVKG